jgi:hypothetical protein
MIKGFATKKQRSKSAPISDMTDSEYEDEDRHDKAIDSKMLTRQDKFDKDEDDQSPKRHKSTVTQQANLTASNREISSREKELQLEVKLQAMKAVNKLLDSFSN